MNDLTDKIASKAQQEARAAALAAARAARQSGNGAKRRNKSLSESPEQRRAVSGAPATWRATYLKAVRGQSRSAAIKAKCGDCTNWQRAEIADCRVPTCPLYAFRPFHGRQA